MKYKLIFLSIVVIVIIFLYITPFGVVNIYQKSTEKLRQNYEVGNVEILFNDYDTAEVNLLGYRKNEKESLYRLKKNERDYDYPFASFMFKESGHYFKVGFQEASPQNMFIRKVLNGKHIQDIIKLRCEAESILFSSLSSLINQIGKSYNNDRCSCCTKYKERDICYIFNGKWYVLFAVESGFTAFTDKKELFKHFDINFKSTL